jgi:hypothetical protein
MKGQSRRHSVIESALNMIVGYAVAFATQLIVYPFFHINLSLSDNALIGVVFMITSLGRSYLLRRIFNRISIGAQ